MCPWSYIGLILLQMKTNWPQKGMYITYYQRTILTLVLDTKARFIHCLSPSTFQNRAYTVQ